MHRKVFSHLETDMLAEIIDYSVYHELLRYLAEGGHTITGRRLDALVRNFSERYETLTFLGFGRADIPWDG